MLHQSRGLVRYLLLGVLSFGLFLGCTEDFEELNVDQAKLASLGAEEYPFLFSKAQSASSYAFWRYQVAQNLFADLYAQYYATTATYFPSDRNVIRMDWMQWHWRPIYTDAVPQLKVLLTELDPSSPEYAMASVTWVYAFHRLTDYYGPVPYFQAGEPLESVPYDPQEQIYDDFFKRLDAAQAVFRANAGGNAFGSFDLIYGGDIDKWLRFTNSLRLRLALRISDVDPIRAQTEAEAAVASGVLEDPADDAYMSKTEAGTDVNGLAGISVWNEFRMSASMESALKGYEDPRIGVFFQPVDDSGEYNGLRNGLTPAQLGDPQNLAQANSNVGSRWVTGGGSAWAREGTTPQNIMHAAEAYFNRAEGALNNWDMGGSAEELYNAGIEASMKQWGITDEAAIAAYQESESTPVAPGDFLNSPPVFDAPIDFGDSEAMQRLQIATQKWLALYPDGIEAWANLRRTDLPDLYPVANSENSDIPDGERPNRIPFIDYEKNTNGEAVAAAVSLLKGPDVASTRLWWDVN
ncbi:SusD/RagB family nutrient-binding outer membrane lipoprotein [Lewinella sp. JB7]|uniref:SusD/RagB family nutrient-binding outer membrane lipoprotein n=1 Tax=Lewinella sp. JB7 TaxID=2962887 RepID=UPI0020C9C48C|nr:SusD/RagB family nutrient-binding outer membrane lipoprotein [Lewinella sp. JB7]MCP9237105.1 SusD/RagB family nutrient-binding outer membrane lipoprotein [Lewinella sp. JB7]